MLGIAIILFGIALIITSSGSANGVGLGISFIGLIVSFIGAFIGAFIKMIIDNLSKITNNIY